MILFGQKKNKKKNMLYAWYKSNVAPPDIHVVPSTIWQEKLSCMMQLGVGRTHTANPWREKKRNTKKSSAQGILECK